MDASLELNALLELFEERRLEIEKAAALQDKSYLPGHIEGLLVHAVRELVIKGEKVYRDAIPYVDDAGRYIVPKSEEKIRKRILIPQDHALYRQLLCIRLTLAGADEVFPILDHQEYIFDNTILFLPEDMSYRAFIKDDLTEILKIFLPVAHANIHLTIQKWLEGNIQLDFNFTENGRFTSHEIKRQLKDALLSISKDNEADWVDRLFEGQLHTIVNLRSKPTQLAELFYRLKQYKIIINATNEKIVEFLSLHFLVLSGDNRFVRINKNTAFNYLEESQKRKGLRNPLFTHILPLKKTAIIDKD